MTVVLRVEAQGARGLAVVEPVGQVGAGGLGEGVLAGGRRNLPLVAFRKAATMALRSRAKGMRKFGVWVALIREAATKVLPQKPQRVAMRVLSPTISAPQELHTRWDSSLSSAALSGRGACQPVAGAGAVPGAALPGASTVPGADPSPVAGAVAGAGAVPGAGTLPEGGTVPWPAGAPGPGAGAPGPAEDPGAPGLVVPGPPAPGGPYPPSACAGPAPAWEREKASTDSTLVLVPQ